MDKMEHMTFEEFRKAAAAKLDELDALAKELREERTKPISQQLAEGMQKVQEEMILGKPFNKEGKPVEVNWEDIAREPEEVEKIREIRAKKQRVSLALLDLTKTDIDDIVTVLQAFSSLPLGEQYGLLAGSGIDVHDEDIQYLEGKLRAILKDM